MKLSKLDEWKKQMPGIRCTDCGIPIRDGYILFKLPKFKVFKVFKVINLTYKRTKVI